MAEWTLTSAKSFGYTVRAAIDKLSWMSAVSFASPIRCRHRAFRGVATYYHVRGGGPERTGCGVELRAIARPPVADLVAFEFDKLDGWLEEDDPIRGHPRDPYHRFDY